MQEDDARSGVGAQRGGGVHKRYVKRFDRKTRDETTEDDWEARASAEDTGTEDTLSDGSSTSSLFEQYFPKVRLVVRAVLRCCAASLTPLLIALFHSQSAQQ